MKERFWFFDNGRAVLMLLVVFGHVIEPLKENSIYNSIYCFLYVFHMPCFVFISGYFSKRSTTVIDGLSKYIAPFVAFQILYRIMNFIFKIQHPANSLIKLFAVPVRTLWYLPSLFCWVMLQHVIIKIFGDHRLRPVLISSFLLLPFISGVIPVYAFSIPRTLYFFPFFLFGHVVKTEENNFFNASGKAMKIISLSFFLMLLYLSIVHPCNRGLLYAMNTFKSINFSAILGGLNRSMILILSCASCFFLLKLIPQTQTFLSHFGKKTLQIFLLHDLAIRFLIFFDVYSKFSGITLALFLVIVTFLIYYFSSLNLFGQFVSYITKSSKKILECVATSKSIEIMIR